MGDGRGVYRILVGKVKRKRPLGRPRRRGEENNMMYVSSGSGMWKYGLG
jgi:predicted MPP superfamily phosphohydrolase